MPQPDEIQLLKVARQRQRAATETLVTRSHLRDNLTDDQAQPLLDWALATLTRDSQRSVALPVDSAETWFDARISAVVEVMGRFNQLVVTLPTLDEAEATRQVLAYFNAIFVVTHRQVELAHAVDLVDNRAEVTVEDLSQRLLNAILSTDSAEEEE